MGSDTNKTPTTSSHIPRAGAALPGPPRPTCNRERGSAKPGPVIPPDPPLPRNGSARGRAKELAKHAGPTAGLMTTGVLSNTAIRQIRAPALGERLQPAIRTETEAGAAHAALVHEIFSALRSALCDAWETPQGPGPHPATGPAAMTHSRTRATRVPHRPCAREETKRRLRDHLLPAEGRAMDVTPTAAHSARNHDDPGRANLAKKDPSYNPTTRGRATHPSNARRSDTPTGKTSTCPTRATDTRRVEPSPSSLWCRTRTKTQQPPPRSPGRGPRFPDPRNPPATEKGEAPHPDPSSHLTLRSRKADPQGAGQRARPNTRDPRPGR